MTLWQSLTAVSGTNRYCPWMPRSESSGPVAVMDIRFAAAAGAREYASKTPTDQPKDRPPVAMSSSSARQSCVPPSPPVRNQLAGQRQIANDGADAARRTWGTETVDGDGGAARGAPSGARSIHRSDRHTGGPSPLSSTAERVGVWPDIVKAPVMRPVALGHRGVVERRLPPVCPGRGVDGKIHASVASSRRLEGGPLILANRDYPLAAAIP